MLQQGDEGFATTLWQVLQEWAPKEHILPKLQNHGQPCERGMQKQSDHMAKKLPMEEVTKYFEKPEQVKKHEIEVTITWQ